jgi:alcohol dehydrogenase
MSNAGLPVPTNEVEHLSSRAASLEPWEAEVASVRLLFGPGRVDDLGSIARGLEAREVLLVTDAGVQAAGHVKRAVASLLREGLGVSVFDSVDENPSSETLERGVSFVRDQDAHPHLLVALGGGSPMDACKGINFLLTNGGRIEDYWGFGKAEKPMLPSIALPTTAGTGSDAQSYALITQPGTQRKMACGDPKAKFRIVVLDPKVAATAPRHVAAAAGLDAVSHAVESFVTTKRNPTSTQLAQTAWRLLEGNLEKVLADAPALAAIGAMQLGAHLAGAAIETSMLGAAHASANPLTARYGIVHGEAVALMLPHVVRFNDTSASEVYAKLTKGGGDGIIQRLKELQSAASLRLRLRDYGIPREALPELARLAEQEWTGQFNPRQVNEDEFLQLYEAAF